VKSDGEKREDEKMDDTGFGDRSLLDADIHDDPYPYYARLRREKPIHYDPKLGMYLVSRYEDIQTILADPLTFSLEKGYVDQYAKGYQDEWKDILAREGGGYFRDMIMTDPPVHTRMRRLLEKAFTAHRVKDLEARIRAIVVDYIERVAETGHAEARREIAVPITASIICEQLGFDHGNVDAATIERWAGCVSAQMGRMQDREQMLENARAMCELQHYLIARVEERRKNPREDMISDLVQAQLDDEENPTLSLEEVVSSTRAFLSAGTDATTTSFLNVLLVFATEPELIQTFRDAEGDERLMTRFTEELLRREPPTHGLARMTSREVELAGTVLPAGAHVLIMYASANYDDREFPDPRAFDIERENLGRHLSFGGGIHRCVGAALARMEIKVFAQEIARRLDDIRLAVPREELRYLPTIATHTIDQLPITFSRRENA
jgi:cytochrome P450